MPQTSFAAAPSSSSPAVPGEAGFSILEVLVSMLLLTVALLGLGQVFMLGAVHALGSSPNLLAREKAREAIESVHTARDTRTITWARIRNVTPRMCPGVAQPAGWNNTAGVFVDGVQPGGLHQAGADGLINTAGDEAEPLETIVHPGADGRLNTADDRREELAQYRREIWICDRSNSLREIRVSVRYDVGGISRTYRLTTYISNYS
jgi:hypothetical protein